MIPPDVGAPRCDREHECITCSDEGAPLRVLRLSDEPGLAICAGDEGESVEVMTGIVGDVRVGDTLLVHAGTALMRWTNTEEPPGEVRR